MSCFVAVALSTWVIAMPPTGPFSGAPPAPARPGTVTITTVDPDGKPVPGAYVQLNGSGPGSNYRSSATTNARGEATIRTPWIPNNPRPVESVTAIVWSDHFAAGDYEMDIPSIEAGNYEVTVRMLKGRETEVRVIMPDGSPAEADLKIEAHERIESDHHFSTRSRAPIRTAPGSFWFVSSPDSETSSIHVLDQERYNGWSGPIDLSESVHTIELPEPGGIEINFTPDEPGPAFAFLMAYSEWKSPNGLTTHRHGHQIASSDQTGEEFHLASNNLAPGEYEVAVGTGTLNTRWQATPRYGRKVTATVVSGETTRVEFREGDYDLSFFDGTSNIEFRLEDGSGPAAGVEWLLYGPHSEVIHHEQRVLARQGVTDADGIARVERINISHHLSFHLKLTDGTLLGELSPYHFRGAREPGPMRFLIPARLGDPVADADITRMSDGRVVQLSEYDGRIVALIFWSANATSTITSADFMDEWDVIAAREAEQWGERVAMVAVNTDHALQIGLRMVHDRGWHSLENLWCEVQGSGLSSDLARGLGVTQVPWVVILDPNRRIAVSGSPRDIDVEEEIGKLME